MKKINTGVPKVFDTPVQYSTDLLIVLREVLHTKEF
jgi:hypothetical protein